jgi:hypothetical protein
LFLVDAKNAPPAKASCKSRGSGSKDSKTRGEETKRRQDLMQDRREDVETEVIKDDEGHIIGEIREENGNYLVWKRERPTFPPTNRHTFFGSAETLEEARRLAETLLR